MHPQTPQQEVTMCAQTACFTLGFFHLDFSLLGWEALMALHEMSATKRSN